MKYIFFIFFIFLFSLNTYAFPKKKLSLIQDTSLLNKNLEERLFQSGYFNSLIDFCSYNQLSAKNNKDYIKNLKGFIGYVNWDLFRYFNSGVSIFERKKEQGWGIIKYIDFLYKMKGCDGQSLDIAVKNNLKVIESTILPFIQNSSNNNYLEQLDKLQTLILSDKRNNYEIFVKEIDKGKLISESDTAKIYTEENKENNNDQMLHEWTTEAGYHIAWIQCSSGGNGSIIAQEIRTQVLQLSRPDFKVLVSAALSAEHNPPQKVGFACNSGTNKFKEVKEQLYNYVAELKSKVDGKFVATETTTVDSKEEKQIQIEDETQINKELQEAQHYINDLQEFVKVNPTAFDILKVTKLMIASKDILSGVWNADQQNNFNAFKEYVNTSDAFLAFHAQQTEKRQATLQNQINAETDKLNSYISDLTSYLQNNLTSDLAPEILEIIESAQAVLEKKKLQELINANQNIASFMQKLNQIDAEVIKLGDYVNTLTTYLQNNLTSDLAPEILEQIESAQAAIERKNLQELLKINKDITSFVKNSLQIQTANNNLQKETSENNSQTDWSGSQEIIKEALDAAKNGDFTTALKELEPLANQGHPEAQYLLSNMYYGGHGVTKNFKKAFELCKLAANKGYVPAQQCVALSYLNGEGIEQDYREAAKWFELAAEQGDAVSQWQLGYQYAQGWGVTKDIAIAWMWIKISVENNSEYKLEHPDTNNARNDLASVQTWLDADSNRSWMEANLAYNNCVRQKYKGCKSNKLKYSKDTEKKLAQSGLPICPEYDPNKIANLKWNNCWGVEENENGKYEGKYVNGMSNGKGTFYWNNGDKYVGEFKDNRVEGQGIIYFANGDKYEGMFLDYQMTGIGKLTFASGNTKEGIWKDGELIESKKTNKLIPVEKEYVAIVNANVREQPFVDSKLVKTLSKGTVVLVLKKTESNDWLLIKEIKKNWGDEDIGKILGYSSADLYQSLDTLGVSENENTGSKKYSEPPGILLTNAYLYYTVIKKMHELREGYAVVYINYNQMSEAKKQIQEIEDVLLSKFKLDEDLLWDMAMKKYEKDYSSVDLVASTGHYSEDGSRVAMMVLLGLDSIAKEVVGSSIEKDF